MICRDRLKEMIDKSGGVKACSKITGYAPNYIKRLTFEGKKLTPDFFVRFCHKLGYRFNLEELGKIYLHSLGIGKKGGMRD